MNNMNEVLIINNNSEIMNFIEINNVLLNEDILDLSYKAEG